MGSIYARKRNGITYYVYQEAFRVKVDPLRSGKTKGSGKSTVRTKVTYLGTAENILNAVQEQKESKLKEKKNYVNFFSGSRRSVDTP